MTKTRAGKPADDLLVASTDESLLDVVDNLLNLGVVLHGDVVLGLAGIDLIYLRLSLLLCAADRVLPPSSSPSSSPPASSPSASSPSASSS